MRRWLLAGAIAVSACATPQTNWIVENVRVINAPEEVVWPEVVRYFATRSIPIRTIERASGIIAAEQQVIGSLDILDCTSGVVFQSTKSARFNVLVQRKGEATEVTVTPEYYEAGTDLFGGFHTEPCRSTGILERQILNAIEAAARPPG